MTTTPSRPASAEQTVAMLVAELRASTARGESVDPQALLTALEPLAGVANRGGESLSATLPVPGAESVKLKAAVQSAGLAAVGPPDYELLRIIGQGAMGVVYEARQRSLNRKVALKMIRAGHLAGDDDVSRFQAEAEAAASLRHPNIVAVYEIGRVGDDGQQHYFTMDLVAGASLQEMVRQRPLEARRAARYVAQVARAIQFAHERGVLHRDVKSANILVGEDDEPRVTDFGLAKRIDSDSQLTRSGTLVGTPAYMSPELAQSEHERVGPPSDVYSLGAVLYECLTGRPPLVGPSLADLLNQVVSAEPLPPSRLAPKVPRDLETICLKCLEKQPQRRYATAGALADDLERFLCDEPIRARPVGPIERGLKFARRKPAWTALGLVSATAALVLAVVIGLSNYWLAATNSRLSVSEANAKANYRSLRRSTYSTQIQKAEDYWQDDPPNLARGRELLASLIPPAGEEDLRGLEWYFLNRLCDNQRQRVRGGGAIGDMTLWDDGRLAVYDQERRVVEVLRGRKRERQWRLRSEDDIDQWRFARRAPWCVTLSVSKDIQLRHADRPDKVEAVVGQARGPFAAVAITEDGGRIAYADEFGPLVVWDVKERREVARMDLEIPGLRRLRLSTDGQWAALASQYTLTIADLSSQRVQTITAPKSRKFTDAAFSPDNKQVAAAFEGGQVELWNVTGNDPPRTLNLLKLFIYPTTVTFLPDKRLAIGSSNSLLIVLDIEQDVPYVYRGHDTRVTHLAPTQDGRRLLSAAFDGDVLEWDLSVEDQRAHVLRHQAADGAHLLFRCLSYSPDGKRLACGGTLLAGTNNQAFPGRVLLVDPQAVAVEATLDAPLPIATCTFSPDGKLLLYGGAQGSRRCRSFLWDVAQRQTRGELPVGTLAVASAAFATAEQVVVGGDDGRLRTLALSGTASAPWEAPTRQIRYTSPWVSDIVTSGGGRFALSCGDDTSIRLWDAQARRELIYSVGHVDRIALALAPGGQWAAWTAPAPRVLASAESAGDAPSPAVRLPEASAAHQQVLLFDIEKRAIRFVVSGHTSPVQALAFSDDGRRLASGDSAGILKLWDTETGSELLSMDAHLNGVSAIAIHPGGRQMASVGGDAVVRLWRTE